MLEVNRPPAAGTFTQFIAGLPQWEIELLRHIEMTSYPFSVAVAIMNGLRAVSDGSDWDRIQGAYGWAMSTDLGVRCAVGWVLPTLLLPMHIGPKVMACCLFYVFCVDSRNSQRNTIMGVC
jgi:hypothetical protein